MEFRALEVQRLPTLPSLALLACAESAEVLRGLRHDVREELELNAARGSIADGDLEEHPRVSFRLLLLRRLGLLLGCGGDFLGLSLGRLRCFLGLGLDLRAGGKGLGGGGLGLLLPALGRLDVAGDVHTHLALRQERDLRCAQEHVQLRRGLAALAQRGEGEALSILLHRHRRGRPGGCVRVKAEAGDVQQLALFHVDLLGLAWQQNAAPKGHGFCGRCDEVPGVQCGAAREPS
mmetsp:Transcript_92151/g.298060  ORF Transcript_92151/g.298060 Transcript_92151/m.298060 type:complete len:234 (+) Transcript_92151:520-1221(+)